ncbi:MAG: CvpA family protein [Spirosomataceae bacterium]
MNTLDLLLAIPVVYGMVRGYQQGLLIELVGILAFIGAMAVGFSFLDLGLDTLAPYLGERLTRRFLPYLSFAVIFFPTLYLINQIGKFLRSSIRYTILGTFDSWAGALVGGFTWIFGLSTVCWLLQTIGVLFPVAYTDGSILYPYVLKISPWIIANTSDWIPVGGHLVKEWLESW